MICVRTQMFTNNHRLLQNSSSLPQLKIVLNGKFHSQKYTSSFIFFMLHTRCIMASFILQLSAILNLYY